MPIYEYICDECKTSYEKIVLSKVSNVSCPKCGSARKTLQLSSFSTPRPAPAGAGPKNGAGAASNTPTCMGNPSACGCSRKN